MGNKLTAAGQEAWKLFAEMWFNGTIHDRFHEACEVTDLSPPQLKALLSLEPGQGQPMRALAEDWKCDASWVTGIVDGLEDRGYVERQVHPKDRRIKVVVITERGLKAKAAALDALYQTPDEMARLTAPEQRQLRDLLVKFGDRT